MTVTIDKDIFDSVEERADNEDRSRSSMVNYLLRNALKNKGSNNMSDEAKNGKNADYMRLLKSVESNVVDMIYIDPPLLSGRSYAALWDEEELLTTQAATKDYVEWMRARLIQCRRILKSTGSIYVHCDQRTAHYLRVEMDEIFGMENFRNEGIWNESGTGNINPDFVFWYSKGKNFTFNKEVDAVLECSTHETETLFENIVLVSTNEEDIIFDPMCNNAVLSAVANRLKRSFVWINASHVNSKVEANVCNLEISYGDVRNMSPLEFQEWACKTMSGEVLYGGMDDGIDGLVHTSPTKPRYHGSPIQVKRSEKVGPNMIRIFIESMKKMPRENSFLIAFSFTESALEKASEFNQGTSGKIHLLTVEEIMGKNFEEIIEGIEG